MGANPNNSEQNPRPFRWTRKSENAALLIAEGELSDEKIAERVGAGRTTLFEWRRHPDFAARVQAHLDEFRAAVRRRGIAIVENRVRALQDRWERMQRVITERAASPQMQDVPGGRTGLLVHNVKSIGGGVHAERVDLYELDAALLKELRDHEKQAAQELGQWTEKSDVTSDGKAFALLPIRLDGGKEVDGG
jgi:hypothetical protein